MFVTDLAREHIKKLYGFSKHVLTTILKTINPNVFFLLVYKLLYARISTLFMLMCTL